MNEQPIIIEEMTDPAEIARHLAQSERARRNSEWLASHWADVLPDALGRFVAVAGQEPFIADSAAQAIALAEAAHPDDDGLMVRYVRPERGPRIYADQWRLAGE